MMTQDESIKHRIQQAQAGNAGVRNQIIKEHAQFITRSVRQYTHAFIVEDLDEYSIALLAFDQALSRYDPESPVSFQYFARLMIKNRLIDWSRHQKRHTDSVSLSETTGDDQQTILDHLPDQKNETAQSRLEFEESLLKLQLQLEAFRLDFNKMAKRLPKHRDSRLFCLKLARLLCEDNELSNLLWHKKRLPAAELAKRCQAPIKTIERNRANIIFYALLLHSDLEVLKQYMTNYEKEESL